MLLRISRYGGTTLDLNSHPGEMAVELDMDSPKGQGQVTYYGSEGIDMVGVELQPNLVEDPPGFGEGVATWFLDPVPCAPVHQIRQHRYLIRYSGGDTYVTHPAYRNITLTEHNLNCWELSVEGIKARIVMPLDFKAAEAVMET